MDRLSALLKRFSLDVSVFNTAELCTAQTFPKARGIGHIHVLKEGELRVKTYGRPTLHIKAPYLLFYFNPTSHQLIPVAGKPAVPVCAEIHFGEGLENPLIAAIPDLIAIDLQEYRQLDSVVALLFREADLVRCGRQAALDRLCELLLIELLRLCLDKQLSDVGTLAGLADLRLAKALNLIHEQPAASLSLEELADEAGMSRASFASKFRETVGMTPGDYITQWRLGIAKNLLKMGRPVAWISDEVGYSNAAVFSRAFKNRFGVSPRSWTEHEKSQA